MFVYCRVAPPSVAGGAEAYPLLIHSHSPANTGTHHHQQHQRQEEEVEILDPVTGNSARFACAGVFLPGGLASPVDGAPPSGDSQAAVYQRVCGSFLPPRAAARSGPAPTQRNVLLAYGQTASGKTHTLFGSVGAQQRAERRSRHRAGAASSAVWWAAQLRSPTAGLVPRFLADAFDDAVGRAAWVDVSCVEVYGEATTDLVALLAADGGGGGKTARPTRPAASSHRRSGSSSGWWCGASSVSSLDDGRFNDTDGDDDGGSITVEDVTGIDLLSFGTPGTSASFGRGGGGGELPFSVEAAAQRYAAATSAPRAGARAVYKPTERGQVLAHMRRARCGSAVEAWAVVSQLLARRRRSATDRNAASSRGHLLLRVEHYGAAAGAAALASETLFCDLAGSESHRAADPPPAGSRSSSAVRRGRGGLRGGSRNGEWAAASRAASNTSVASSSGAWSSDDGAGTGSSFCSGRRSTAAAARGVEVPERQREMAAARAAATRRGETQGINTSLLALRKVMRALHLLSTRAGPSSSSAAAAHQRPHIPFKESTLTTILEPFLLLRGAAASAGRVAVVVCCSSRQSDFHETVASLRFGAEATTVQPAVARQALPQPPSAAAAASRGTGRSLRRTHSAPTFRQPTDVEAAAAAAHLRAADGPLRPRRDAGTQADLSAPAAEQSETVTALEAELAALRRRHDALAATKAELARQFALLCGHYKESVEALAGAERRAGERDHVIARLTAELEAQRGAAPRGRGESVSPWAQGSSGVVVSPPSPRSEAVSRAASTDRAVLVVGCCDGVGVDAAAGDGEALAPVEESADVAAAPPAPRLAARSAGPPRGVARPPPPPTPSPPRAAVQPTPPPPQGIATADSPSATEAEGGSSTKDGPTPHGDIVNAEVAAQLRAHYARLLQRPSASLASSSSSAAPAGGTAARTPFADVTNRSQGGCAAAGQKATTPTAPASSGVPVAAPCHVYKL